MVRFVLCNSTVTVLVGYEAQFSVQYCSYPFISLLDLRDSW